MRPLALAAILLAPLLLAGCTGPGAGDQPNVELTLELDQDTLEEGEQVAAHVTITNHGEQAYTFEHPGCPPEPFKIRVPQEGNQEIRLYTYGQEAVGGACAVRNATLEPGQTVEATVHWNGHVDEAQPDPHGGERVTAGEHTIRAELARSDQGPTFAQTATVTVR